jgi:signal peptidase II
MEPDADPEANPEPPAQAGAEPSGSSVASAPSSLADTLVAVPPPPPSALAITLVAPPPPSPGFPPPSFAAPPIAAPPFAAPLAEAHAPVAATSHRRPASIAVLIAITVTSLAADLVTKGWAKANLEGVESKSHALRHLEIWKGYVEFIFARNPGGAWSFLRNLPDSLRRPFFLVVSAAAIVFIITIYRRVNRDQWAMKVGLPLALGGAVGNLVDRIRYGWVVDFIDISLKWGGKDHHWPTFNVADIAIVVGVGLMAIDMLRSRGLPHEEPPATMSPLSASGVPVTMGGDQPQG